MYPGKEHRVGLFDGKVALVVGATAGIGRAAAVAFAREGARVVAAGRREPEGEETARLCREAGDEAVFVRADVTRESDVAALVDRGRRCLRSARLRVQQRRFRGDGPAGGPDRG